MDIKPSTEALTHSHQLSNLIRSKIENGGGWLPFSNYMDLALYAPGLGYYAAGAHKIGLAGDFITAPELSPWFGASIAQTISPVLDFFRNNQQSSQIIEFGAGSGALAQSVLEQLFQEGQAPSQYSILEVSPDLRQRQQVRLSAFQQQSGCPTSIVWLDQLPKSFHGVILANEVIDAFPIELIVKRGRHWHLLGVCNLPEPSSSQEKTSFILKDGPIIENELLPEYLQEISDTLPEGYQTEIHLQAQAWVESISKSLTQGLFLTLDYGFPAREYYHPQRSSGTLMAHYRHHATPDPFHLPGLSDITAHVEWTTLSDSAMSAGLDLLGYQSQAAYLLNAGISELLLANLDPRDPISYLPHANAVQKLLSEAEMGELFKAIAFGKSANNPELDGILQNLPGFTGRPRPL